MDERGSYYDNRIHINGDMAISRQWRTLFHKIIHSLSKNAGLELTEVRVTTLSDGIFQVL